MRRILAVLFLVAGIATTGGYIFKPSPYKKTDRARTEIEGIGKLLNIYHSNTGHYPKNDRGFFVLFDDGLIDSTKLFYDPWKSKYVYRNLNTDIVLYSIGPNLSDDNGLVDDIAL